MGRELQKKKRHSRRQPVRPKKPAKALNPRGNTLIARSWDKNETLAQNYRRLGLVARLKAPAGGTERKLGGGGGSGGPGADDAFAIAPVDKALVSEARVQRDADGNIVRVLRPRSALDSDSDSDGDPPSSSSPASDEDDDASPPSTDVVRSLVALARNPAPKRPRLQSGAERQWLQRLVARHGADAAAMARDRRLNPMQQTAADIARRLGRAGLAA